MTTTAAGSTRSRERWGFPLASFGQNLIQNFVGLYLLVYLVDGVGLSVAGIAKATAILTGAKIWDAIADLLIGVLVDRTRTRWGRFRPYILAMVVPIAVLTTLLFHVPPGSEDAQLLYFGIVFVLFAMAYTLADVPYWSLVSVIATDERSRTLLISLARTAGALGLAAMTLGGTPLARALSFGPVTTAAGWGRAALLTSVVGVGLYSLAFFATQEKLQPAGEPLSFGQTLRRLVGNRSLFLLLASGALGFGRFALQVGGAVVALVVFGDETIFTLLGASLIVAMIIATLATPALLRRVSRRAAMIGCTLAAVVAHTGLWFVGYGSLPVALVLVFVIGLTLGVFMVTQTAMIVDTADEGEVLTGQRNDAVCFAGLTFLTKFDQALATVAVGMILAGVGYTKGVDVTPFMRDGVWATITLVPAASCLVSLLPLLPYRVPEQDLPRLLEEARSRTKAA